ncbi:MAG: formylglycine-generating enzyme family protein, partial [Planctomycetota bacterium]
EEVPETRTFRFARGGTRSARSLEDLGVRLLTPREAAERGGVSAKVLSSGEIREVTLPEGLRLRATASPLPLTPGTVIGTTPIRSHPLERGEYLAVVRMPGHEERRWLFLVRPASHPRLRIPMSPEGSAPEGFVRVPGPRDEEGGPFWFMEREVTCAEYLEFLNDPETLERIASSPDPILFPRDPPSLAKGGHWPRGEDGRFSVVESWREDWPVIGVSFDDARAYADWRTERARRAGSGLRFSLPTRGQWEAAAGDNDRRYVHGNRFRPKWVKSCFSRPRAIPEPILRFPRDESPYGAYDVGGGAMEWCDGWFDRGRGLRLLKGGSWARAQEEFFLLYGGFGMPPGSAGGETGFRLVATERSRER